MSVLNTRLDAVNRLLEPKETRERKFGRVYESLFDGSEFCHCSALDGLIDKPVVLQGILSRKYGRSKWRLENGA